MKTCLTFDKPFPLERLATGIKEDCAISQSDVVLSTLCAHGGTVNPGAIIFRQTSFLAAQAESRRGRTPDGFSSTRGFPCFTQAAHYDAIRASVMSGPPLHSRRFSWPRNPLLKGLAMLRIGLTRWFALAATLFGATVCAGPPGFGAPPADGFGVLIMAHGGEPEWNQAVLEAVAPLRERYPIEVAFGMADAVTIQEAIDALEAAGVRNIGVVRLFVSGESWLERTEQILGLYEGAPPVSDLPATGAELHGSAPHTGHHHEPRQHADEKVGSKSNASHHHGDAHHHSAPHAGTDPHVHAGVHHHAAFFRVRTESRFALSRQGLADAAAMGMVLADRAKNLSRTPQEEVVLVLAHGPADDEENARWLASLDARAQEVRRAAPFHRVEVQTLREDWPDKRAAAEQRIRAFVARAAAGGRQAIVLPYRVHGFGPYAEVLKGLTYVADGHGLLPDVRATQWIEHQADALRQGAFRAPLATPADEASSAGSADH